MIEALSSALPLVPDEPMSDGRSANDHLRSLLDASQSISANPGTGVRIDDADVFQFLSWISKTCFGMPAAVEVQPPGATIG